MTLTAMLAAVLIYPTVARTGTNLLADAKWRPGLRDPALHAFSVSKGGPFSADGKVWQARTFRVGDAYWNTRVKILPGHEYLAGYWVRFSNCRTLLWTCGRDAKTGARKDLRLYCNGGFKQCLKPYFSEDVVERICGPSDKWRLCFRMLNFPDGLKDGILHFSGGCYPSFGSMEFAEPFLVDVTGHRDRTLSVTITEGKPVKRLDLFRIGIRDTVWSREFDQPVADTTLTIPAHLADYRLGQEEDANVINGHGLDVLYADGTRDTVYAPQEYVFRVME